MFPPSLGPDGSWQVQNLCGKATELSYIGFFLTHEVPEASSELEMVPNQGWWRGEEGRDARGEVGCPAPKSPERPGRRRRRRAGCRKLQMQKLELVGRNFLVFKGG